MKKLKDAGLKEKVNGFKAKGFHHEIPENYVRTSKLFILSLIGRGGVEAFYSRGDWSIVGGLKIANSAALKLRISPRNFGKYRYKVKAGNLKIYVS